MGDSADHDIQISVTTAYLASRSDPADGHYAFSYTIKITNTGSQAARLLDRHWIITDADGEQREVKGKGVVGEQPYLEPGASFEYTSGAVLPTPVGSMHGHYGMEDADGHRFHADIAPFTLAVPGALN